MSCDLDMHEVERGNVSFLLRQAIPGNMWRYVAICGDMSFLVTQALDDV